MGDPRNVEAVRRALAAWNRGDLEALLELCDPEIEFVPLIAHADGGMPLRGHEGVRQWWREAEEVFAHRSIEIRELREEDDWVVVHGVGRGTGRESRAPVEWPFVQTVRMRGGKATDWRFFVEEAEAWGHMRGG